MVNNAVTVIIVNYNAGRMLSKCIDNVLASTIKEIQIIVSDNASTDQSLATLKEKYSNTPNIMVHQNEKNLGFSRANNAVYAQVSSPFILYLNPDCFIEPNTIEHFLKIMEKYPEAGMAGCLVTNMDGSEQLGCRGLTPTPKRVLNQLLKLSKLFPNKPEFSGYIMSGPISSDPFRVELISGSCMFVRKAAIEEVGLLDEQYFLYCEDYDWFYRFIQKNWAIIFTPQTQVQHIKSHSTKQIPFKVLRYKARGMWRYHDKFFKGKSPWIVTAVVRLGIVLRLGILTIWLLLERVYNSTILTK